MDVLVISHPHPCSSSLFFTFHPTFLFYIFTFISNCYFLSHFKLFKLFSHFYSTFFRQNSSLFLDFSPTSSLFLDFSPSSSLCLDFSPTSFLFLDFSPTASLPLLSLFSTIHFSPQLYSSFLLSPPFYSVFYFLLVSHFFKNFFLHFISNLPFSPIYSILYAKLCLLLSLYPLPSPPCYVSNISPNYH